MNNNMTTERALLDVFAPASYITIGEKEKPLSYPYKAPVRSCYASKQFLTNPPKQGVMGAKVPEVYLDNTHKWVSEGVPYVDKLMYKDTQKEKKKGFLTGGFKRRDEFSLNFTTEQYRERLTQEGKHTANSTAAAFKEMQAAMEAELAASGSGASAAKSIKKKPNLYDLVYDGDEAYPTAVKNSMVSGRDTKNPTQLGWERNLGQAKLSSQEYGYGIEAAEHGKPEFARIPLVKSTFYRPSTIPITNTLYTQRPS